MEICMIDDAEEFIWFGTEMATPAAVCAGSWRRVIKVDPEALSLTVNITMVEWDNAPLQRNAVRNEFSILGKLVCSKVWWPELMHKLKVM